jgi:hypothetical protein
MAGRNEDQEDGRAAMSGEGPISADVLNAAMTSIGLADVQFESVGGKAVLRRAYDDMSLEHFIGLLLTGIGAVHLQRVEVAARLGELEHQAAALADEEPGGAASKAEAELVVSMIAELRKTITAPVLAQRRHQAVAPKLTIGPIEQD